MHPRPRRRRPVIGLAACLALSPLAVGAYAGATVEPGPVHAGNTFGWYRNTLSRWEFKSTMSTSTWRVSGPGLVQNQHGMLTLNTTEQGSVSATLNRAGHAYGRWEIRLRSKRYTTDAADYQVMTELVPTGRAERCGAQNIALESYQLGQDTANFSIHTLPDNAFTSSVTKDLADPHWHTFAVEVTPTHVSWFVDAHVVNTERRSAALSGVPMTVRFTMKAVDGATMNRSRMQMDWLRYWANQHPSTKSIAAPATHRTTISAAC
jgi:hypothetical protein